MSILKQTRAGLGALTAPVLQAETGIGAGAAEAVVAPPSPRPNGNGFAGEEAAAAPGNASSEIGLDDDGDVHAAAEPAADLAEGAGVALATTANAALNPLASAIALMVASPAHRHLFVGDLDWALLPPIALKQCRVFARDGRPVGFASWALVSDEVEARLKSGQTKLKPAEWESGDRCWLVDLIAPFGGADGFVRLLTEEVLKEHEVSVSVAVQFVAKIEEKARRVANAKASEGVNSRNG